MLMIMVDLINHCDVITSL